MGGAEAVAGERLRVVLVVGPTAVGKSAFVLRLAEAAPVEVVSADSVQVYRGLDVGSAKPSPEERRRVPHHLVDVADPFAETMDVHRYGTLAARAIAEVAARGGLPVVAGGTALYVKAALREWLFPGPPPLQERRAEWRTWPTEALYEALRTRDPEAARRLSPHDRPRLVRALEGGGGALRQPSPYDVLRLRLWRPRPELYARIDARARRQWEGGLLAEAAAILCLPDAHPAARALGYREGRWYWRGLVTSAEGLRLFARNTRRFAKRQETWWRRETFDLVVRAGGEEETQALRAVLAWAGRGAGAG